MLAVIAMIFGGLALIGTAFTVAAAVLAQRHRAPPGPPAIFRPDAAALPITVLKPLHGAEPALAANLTTAFAQEYPAPVQIIAGVRSTDDPAHAVVAQVALAHPGVAFECVADDTRHGTNNKISNLINMAAGVRDPLVVLADSDVAWPPGVLARLAHALEPADVGAASCLHAGRGDTGLWSTLAAMDISYRYMPNVIFGVATGLATPMLGPTMALRRETLAAIGGFAAFKDVLADDYEIGRAVRALGLRTVLPPFFVVHACNHISLRQLVVHELRWSVTIYHIDRAGFAGSLVTHGFTLALMAAAFAGGSPLALGVVALSLAARLLLKRRMDAVSGIVSGPLWLVPLRDLLSFGVFCATFFVHDVDWRGARFRVTRDGRLRRITAA